MKAGQYYKSQQYNAWSMLDESQQHNAWSMLDGVSNTMPGQILMGVSYMINSARAHFCKQIMTYDSNY